MIDYMVLGLPRSGTTWTANWLTDSRSICVHDPLMSMLPEDLDKRLDAGGRKTGIACTAIYRYREFIDNHPARRLIIHRPIDEINRSLGRLGLPVMTHLDVESLGSIGGVHVTYDELFDVERARHIYEFLVDEPFDAERHRLLVEMQIEPRYATLKPEPEVIKELLRRSAQGGQIC